MRDQDEQLIDFCAAQYHHFDQADWLALATQDSVKVAALLLSGTSWYKKPSEFNALCNRCGWPKASLPEIVKTTCFDCARFMAMLKRRLSIQ